MGMSKRLVDLKRCVIFRFNSKSKRLAFSVRAGYKSNCRSVVTGLMQEKEVLTEWRGGTANAP